MTNPTKPSARRWMIAAAAAVICATVLGGPGPASAQPSGERIGGENRYATAALVSQQIDSCVVAVANGQSFPDGLAGAVFGWPTVLTETDALPPETVAEFERRQAKCTREPGPTDPPGILRIRVLGGTAAVSGAVVDQLQELAPSSDIVRFGGADRYETALAIAEKVAFEYTVDPVILATGKDFPDALAAGVLAVRMGSPILLNDGDTLRGDIADFLADNKVENVIVLGGTAAVPASIDDQLRGLGITPLRLAGGDRFETAAAIADHLATFFEPAGSYIVNGNAFPDALAAGPPAGVSSAPILLVNHDNVPGPATDWLLKHSETLLGKVTAIGGTAVVSDDTLAAAVQAATPTK